jgi:hypothetical protein
MRSKICCLLFLLVAWSQPAAGGKCEFGEFAHDYLTALANTRTTVLYSECKQNWGKSLLIIPVLAPTGGSDHPTQWGPYYPELEGKIVLMNLRETCTESFATVRLDDGGHGITAATSGGPQVRSWNARLVRTIEKWPFRMISPERLEDIVKSRPVQNCD